MPTAGCVAVPSRAGLAAPSPTFDPLRFFAGRTAGEGELRVLLSGSRPVRVAGEGRVEPGGTLTLVQQVRRGERPPGTRTWRLRALEGGRFAGTLTDAIGPVRAEVSGNRLHVRFRMRGGFDAEQWLFLQPGGGTVLNRMTVCKFGLPVASLRETIRRLP